MKCNKCGKEISYGASFCDHCGNIIKYNETNPYSKATTNKTNPALIIVVIAIIIITMVIIGFISAKNQTSVIKQNILRYNLPDTNESIVMNGITKIIHNIKTDSNNYYIQVNVLNTEEDALKYINNIILDDSSYINDINNITINSKEWFYYSEESNNINRYHYVRSENKTIYDVLFTCEKKNEECTQYKNKFINTLEIK